MVSKDFISKMLNWLGEIYDKRVDDKLVSAYYFRLKAFDEDKIREIIFKWADVDPKFPKIADIISQLPKGSMEDNQDFLLEEHRMCMECNKKDLMCIKEPRNTGSWRCRRCYTGLTNEQIEEKFKELGRIIDGKKEQRKGL
jgi:hypothetical protein